MAHSSWVERLLCMLGMGSQPLRRGQNFSPVWTRVLICIVSIVPEADLEAHGPVVAADAVEAVLERRHAAAAAPAGHARHRRPPPHPRVQPLHRGLQSL